MARSPNEKVEKAHELYREGMKLVDIAAKLDVPAGTMRRWKRIYQWDDERKSEHLQKKKACVQKLSVQKNNTIADEVQIVVKNTELTDNQVLQCAFLIFHVF